MNTLRKKSDVVSSNTECFKPGFDAHNLDNCGPKCLWSLPVSEISAPSFNTRPGPNTTATLPDQSRLTPHFGTNIFPKQQQSSLPSFNRHSNLKRISADEDILINSIKQLQIQENSGQINQDIKLLRCSICNVNLNSIVQAKAHISGAKHTKLCKDLNPLKRKVLEAPLLAEAGGKNLKPSFFCVFCQVELNSNFQAEEHFASVKHQRKVNQKGDATAFKQPASSTETYLHCKVCGISFTSEVHAKTHYEGKKHASKLKATQCPAPPLNTIPMPAKSATANLNSNEENDKDNQSRVKKTIWLDQKSTNDQPIWTKPTPDDKQVLECRVCRITVNSETQLKAHHVSKKHMQAVEQITKRGCGRGRGYLLGHLKKLITAPGPTEQRLQERTPFASGTTEMDCDESPRNDSSVGNVPVWRADDSQRFDSGPFVFGAATPSAASSRFQAS